MLIKMKEKNLFNYLKIHKVEVPENINISIVSLPSLISKTTEIKKSKNENKHANMKFTFSEGFIRLTYYQFLISTIS